MARSFNPLSGRRHEVVPHSEGRGPAVLNEAVEQAEDRLPDIGVALQLQGPSVHKSLQQDSGNKYCVGLREHCLGILYGGEGAAYNMTLDRIRMPDRRYFVGTETSTPTEAFYSVLFHELVHWSGHPMRLNRDLSGRFGTCAYAVEELVAELGAAFLCADLGVSLYPRRDHAAYVFSWLAVLRQQKSAIFTAASSGTAACHYLRQTALQKQRAA